MTDYKYSSEDSIAWKDNLTPEDEYKMPGEVRIYDGKGNLKRIITKEELRRRSMEKLTFTIKSNFRKSDKSGKFSTNDWY